MKPTPDLIDAADAITRYTAAQVTVGDRIGSAVLAILLGAAGAAVLLSWLQPCEGASLCMLAAIRTCANGLWASVRRYFRWCVAEARVRYLEFTLQYAEAQVDGIQAQLIVLPAQLKNFEAFVASRRVQLLDAQRAADNERMW